MYKVVPHHRAQSHQVQSNEDNTPAHKVLPILTCQKRVLCKATSDLSEQNVGSNSSQEEDNSPDEDLLNLNNNELAVAFDNKTVRWDGSTVQGTSTLQPTQHTNHDNLSDLADDVQEASSSMEGSHLDEASDTGTLTDDIRAEPMQHRVGAHYPKFFSNEGNNNNNNNSKEEDLDTNCPHLFGPHNTGWKRTHFFSASPGQHNICINVQPDDLKDIIKDAIRTLHFESATRLKRGPYSLWAQTDPILQRIVCNLGINPAKPFHHPVIIQTIREAFFKHKHCTKASNVVHIRKNLNFHLQWWLLQLLRSMQASMRVSDLEFNADIYEDSYNTHISTMEEIQIKSPAAYHRLMSDLYKFAS
ncbi:hypothetical protein EI94DRAFT_1700860 [Lactarius quietus]|nr:hypothetical protein EI94DRAFT_1700860 [Lactarius quietus]